jgi:hypothetical protein
MLPKEGALAKYCGSLHITQPKFKCGRHSKLRHPEKLLFSGKTNLEKIKIKRY